MKRMYLLWVAALGLMVVASAVGVVHAKYSSRSHFVELQKLRLQQDKLDEQWGRLQLEQSTWATQHRVESIARKRLQMHLPLAADVVVIEP